MILLPEIITNFAFINETKTRNMNKTIKSILKYLQIKAFNPYLKYMNFLSRLGGVNSTKKPCHINCSL